MKAHRQPELLPVEDYLAAEEASDIRHEYIGGRLYAMTGASVRHNRIAINLLTAIEPATRDKGCEVFMADVKLHLRAGGEDMFYYPDLMVCCDPSDDHPYYRERPCLLVEILSESTERIDRREKWLAYTQIASLQGYLILSQDRMQGTLYRRDTDWHGVSVEDSAHGIALPCTTAAPSLAEFYAGTGIESGD